MNKPQSVLIIFISCAIVGAGLLITIFQGIVHAPEYIAAYFTKVDHPIRATYNAYDQFLQEVVKRDRVDYIAARSSPKMDKALKEFASISCDEFASDGEKLIYWINAYNLLVIKTVSDHMPVNNIKNVSNDLNGKRYTVGGQPITAKDIRQLRIQPLLGNSTKGDCTDCRMLLLICGGAMGYPAVCDHALTPESIGKDMDTNTYKFIHVNYNVYYASDTHTLYISPFFQWNEQTLEHSFADPFEFVIYYMDKNEKPDPGDIHFKKAYNTKFDWRINDLSTQG